MTDPTALDPGLGTVRDFDHLCARLASAGLGHLADIVPNHMGIADNPYRWDVLMRGRSSRYAGFFDIDWNPPKTELRDKLLLPVLEDFFGKVLEGGLIRLVRDRESFVVSYRGVRFPLAPSSLPYLFERASARSAKSSTRRSRSRPAAASRRRGASRRSCAPGPSREGRRLDRDPRAFHNGRAHGIS